MLLTMMASTATALGQSKSTVTDELTQSWTGVTGTTYSSWSDKTSNSDAVWAGQSAGGNSSIQLRSNNNNSGIITTASGGTVTKVTVTWNSNTSSGRTLNVYGKSSAYSSPSDLYNANNQGTLIGTIVYGTSTELDITGTYEYIGMRSASGAMYLTEIDVTWNVGGSGDDPSISAENVEIAYDATWGEIEYTINNPATNGNLTAEVTAGDWLENLQVGETVTFNCDPNPNATARTATVKLTYTYSAKETVTKNVAVTQAGNPDGPGSENNPYTVAQAREAIDAGTGTQGVYATGIVSEIPTAWNSTYNNITFNFVDNSGDTDYLQAYRCGSGTGVDASEVAVGDIVVVYGNLTKYSSTYEFAQGCTLVSLEHPAVSVEAPTFDPEPGTYEYPVDVTMDCETDGVAIYYTTDGTTPTENSTLFDGDEIPVEETTTFKAIAIKGSESSNVTTATYHINSQDDPYTVAQALAFLDYPTSTIFVHGIVSTAPTSALNNGQLTYYISDNGEATDQLEVYKGKGLNGDAFTAQDDIQVGDIVTITGIVKIYNGTKEFDTGNYLVSFERPAAPYINLISDSQLIAPVDGYHLIFDYMATGSDVDIVEYGGFPNPLSASDFYTQFCNADGEPIGETPDWFANEGAPQVVYEAYDDQLHLHISVRKNETGQDRTCYFKIYAYPTATDIVYTDLVTLIQTAAPTPSITFTPIGNTYTPVDAYHIELPSDPSGGYLDYVVYENFSSTLEASDFHIEFCDANGEPIPAEPDWFDQLRVVLNNEQLTLEVSAYGNDGDQRTAYFKVWANNVNDMVYSDIVTVNQAAYVVPPTPGQDVTDVLNLALTGVSGTNYATWSNKTDQSTAVYAGNSAGGNDAIQLRSNNNNSGIISTTSGGTIKEVTVSWNDNTSDGRTLNVYGSNTAYTSPSELYGNNIVGELLGTIVKGTSTELTITDEYAYIGLRSASGAMYIDEIDITWSTGGSQNPSISASNVEIPYDATSGTIEFTINNPVESGVIGVTYDANTYTWITSAGMSPVANTAVFECTVNEAAADRQGIITITYDYGDAIATKDVTITQTGNPNVTMTIAEVRALGDGNTGATIGVVTSISGSNNKTAYIQDATAAIVVFGNFTAAIGDEIRVVGTLSTFNGLLEMTNPTVEVLSNGNTVEPELMTIEEVVASTNQGWYIRIEDATVTVIDGQNVTIAQDNNTVVVRFASANDITFAVNDIISFNGNIGSFNGVQIANPQNVEVQQPTEPSITVTPATVEATFEGEEGYLTITYANIPDLISFDIQFCDANGGELPGDDPDWIYAEINEPTQTTGDYTVYYIIDPNDGEARSAYFKVYTFVGNDLNEVYSNIVTINQAQYVVDYAVLPFEWEGGLPDAFNALNGTTLYGVGSYPNQETYQIKLDSDGDYIQVKTNEQPGVVTVGVKMIGGANTSTLTVQGSADGETFTDIEDLTISGSQNSILDLQTSIDFAATDRYVRLLFTKGSNVGVGPITIAQVDNTPSITLNAYSITATAAETDGTLTVSYKNIETSAGVEINWFEADGQTSATEPDWMFADINANTLNVEYTIEENTGEARTAYFKVCGMDSETNIVSSNLVTVTQAAPSTETDYVLVSSENEIVSGMHYIITNGTNKAMGVQTNNNRSAVDITIANNTATVDNNDGVYEVVINGPDADGNYTIYDKQYPGYLYAASSSSNHLKTRASNSDGNSKWSITFDDGKAVITATGDNTRNLMRYNNSSTCFSCYASGQQDIYLYVKENDTDYEYYGLDMTYTESTIPAGETITVGAGSVMTVPNNFENADPDALIIGEGGQLIHPNTVDIQATLQKSISAYTTKDGNGWYLIATPVDNLSTSVVAQGTYDLFKYNEPTAEWWVDHNTGTGQANHTFDVLYRNNGYLYANESNVDLSYVGLMKSTGATVNVELSYTSSLSDDIRGFNLVGNPFTCNLMKDEISLGGVALTTFYVMNTNRTGLTAITSDEREIKAGEGFFVQAEAEGQMLTFHKSSSKATDSSDLRYIKIVAGNDNGFDNAYIQIGNGTTLRKMNIADLTSVYVMNGDDDYAAARVEELAGSMPVYFEAVQDGTYTITVEARYIDVAYMHLIDTFTGEDIDLTVEPSYTFYASTNDAANRFRLLFDVDNVEENYANEIFAYQSGDELILNGNGELQVFDVMGRFVMSKEISGSERISTSTFETGVYILRMVGETVMTQKIVVR